jgi:hypothetical protein
MECVVNSNSNEQGSGADEESVQVPLYSRFLFPGVDVTSSDDGASDEAAAIAVVRERLGTDAELVCVLDGARGIAVRTARDVFGRARMPRGTHAGPQSSWRGLVVLPSLDVDAAAGGAEREIPIEDIEMTAGEIVAAGGRVVVVIPLLWNVDDADDASSSAASAAAAYAAATVAASGVSRTLPTTPEGDE